MAFQNRTLVDLANHAQMYAVSQIQRKGLAESLQVANIILYGSAARYHIDDVLTYSDFDLNVFLRRMHGYRTRDARRFNRHGKYWRAPDFQDKEVQVLFNIVDYDQTWLDSAESRKSARWDCIRKNPIVQLYPRIVVYRTLHNRDNAKPV